MTGQKFEPSIGDRVRLFREDYFVQEHPQAIGLVFAATGGRADVFQLANKQQLRFGLKVFFKAYRNERILESTKHLRSVERYQGMMAAHRRVITPQEGDASKYKNLHYSILMPWVPGTTWYDTLEQRRIHEVATAKQLASKFLQVIHQLEASGMAHTDISAGNVCFQQNSAQLLDLEDMYIPNGPEPNPKTTGTMGYNHPGKVETWRSAGDRYAAAVLVAELLLMSNEKLASQATSNGFFTENRLNVIAERRFWSAEPYLRELAPKFAELFAEAWNSESLERCPSIHLLYEGLQRDLSRVITPPITPPLAASSFQNRSKVPYPDKLQRRVTFVKDTGEAASTRTPVSGLAEAKGAAESIQTSLPLKAKPRRLVFLLILLMLLVAAYLFGLLRVPGL